MELRETSSTPSIREALANVVSDKINEKISGLPVGSKNIFA